MIENYLQCNCLYLQNDEFQSQPSTESAHTSAVLEDLEVFMFEINLKWQPKTLLDQASIKYVSINIVNDLK